MADVKRMNVGQSTEELVHVQLDLNVWKQVSFGRVSISTADLIEIVFKIFHDDIEVLHLFLILTCPFPRQKCEKDSKDEIVIKLFQDFQLSIFIFSVLEDSLYSHYLAVRKQPSLINLAKSTLANLFQHLDFRN